MQEIRLPAEKKYENEMKALQAAEFDGHYLYVIPGPGRGIARFDAKTPPGFPTPPAFHGSFF